MHGFTSGNATGSRLLRSAALALFVAGCGGETGTSESAVITVTADFAGEGDGLITVTSPDFPAFNWECSKVGGVVVDADSARDAQGQWVRSDSCSRDYDAAKLEVLIYAEGRSSRFTGWRGAQCAGDVSPCRAVEDLGLRLIHGSISATAGFEPSTATVELLVDGRSDAVTLLQGLSASALATAKGSAGQIISGATFAWSSSDPSTVSVTGSSTGNATVTGVSPGTATITATSGGVASNGVSSRPMASSRASSTTWTAPRLWTACSSPEAR